MKKQCCCQKERCIDNTQKDVINMCHTSQYDNTRFVRRNATTSGITRLLQRDPPGVPSSSKKNYIPEWALSNPLLISPRPSTNFFCFCLSVCFAFFCLSGILQFHLVTAAFCLLTLSWWNPPWWERECSSLHLLLCLHESSTLFFLFVGELTSTKVNVLPPLNQPHD